MAAKAPEIRGVDTAQEFFVDGLHDIQFLGVTTLFTPYRTVVTPRGAVRLIPFTCRVPTGALLMIQRQLFEYAREHNILPSKDHDGTR